MTNVINLEFPKCCVCGARATQHIGLIDGETGADAGQKHFCQDHGNVLSMDDLCLLLDKRDKEISELRREISDLKSAPRS